MECVCHSNFFYIFDKLRQKKRSCWYVPYHIVVWCRQVRYFHAIHTHTHSWYAFDHMNIIIKVCPFFRCFYVAIVFRGIFSSGMRLMIEWWAMGQEYCLVLLPPPNLFLYSTIVINVVPFLFPAHISFVTQNTHTGGLIDIIFTICYPFMDAFVCACDERTT